MNTTTTTTTTSNTTTSNEASKIPPKQVLLIDDEEEVYILFKERSRDYNCVYTWASNGNDAVELAEKNKYDLVILDYKFLDFRTDTAVNAPVIFGCEETFRRIKKIDPHVPVVILSGYLSLIVIDTITDISNAAFIKKPKSYNEEFFHFLYSTMRIERKSS